ncbi:hypothetical protein P5663_16280 [Priestia flexa]|uniref:hypothetical protein n=1 Tax=Priestia flexa TaxID=86664 RepID=UPI00240E27FA|nr:hypothetical protein [Priestia flexa]WEZ07576.1 hypothetical protein P5663_16280 [Priestia flexa]
MINKQNYEHETIHDIDKYFVTHHPSDLKYLADKQNRIVVDYQAYAMMMRTASIGEKILKMCLKNLIMVVEAIVIYKDVFVFRPQNKKCPL